MAARTFLLDADLNEARLRLPGTGFPDVGPARRAFSAWLGERLRARLAEFGDFDALGPVILGSWARGELCPRSDIDLLFTGPERDVGDFTRAALDGGLKLRARVPADPADWGRGVAPFDLLALAEAGRRPVSKAERLAIRRAIRTERDERRRRQDSITNFLEPNLKYGPGGLRDIDQALALSRLYPERFVDADPYPFEALAFLKDEFLFLRAHLHLNGAGDILTAADQHDLASRLGWSIRDLMRTVQSELERASFYADWMVDVTNGPASAAKPRVKTPDAVIRALDRDRGMATQFEIRRAGRAPFKALTARARGALLKTALDRDVDDAFVVALYRTRVLERFLPPLKDIRGLVQHDHYHRFTADAHVLQALREVERARNRPRDLGPLAPLAGELKRRDWWTLKLAAMFHDLGKGGDVDHSVAGAALVDRYFRAWGYPEDLRADVRWLVEHHLVLSTAAFRQNPQSRATWRSLFDRGVEGRRLTLLALFTVIDIRATNPDAWTEWKAQLLGELVVNLRSPRARSLREHLRAAPHLEAELLALDQTLLEALNPDILIRDLEAARRADGDLPVSALRAGGKLWVRFHRAVDRPGVFLGFVERLFGFGLSVQMCFVHTLPGIGVYDWFSIKGERTPAQVGSWLNVDRPTVRPDVSVTFQSVELTADRDDEWIFSCRGRDQRGLLVTAARALAEAGLSIRWARVHTWGEQVEDVFGVDARGSVEAEVARLRSRLTGASPT